MELNLGKFLKNDKKPISPIEFMETDEPVAESPIGFIEKDINTETHFAILKTTEGGRYVRGNELYFSLNGVEIYTDINNIIFVDTVNKSFRVKEFKQNGIINTAPGEDPEHKQYVLLYYDWGSDESSILRWEACQGRMRTYENIVVNASVIDIDKSIVLVDDVALKNALSVRAFVNYLKNEEMV